MARRFVRVDLSDGARDFRAVAIEPGVPVLDRPGASGKILFKWLGGMVAEPEWQADWYKANPDAYNYKVVPAAFAAPAEWE
jgi:hypothetical protein